MLRLIRRFLPAWRARNRHLLNRPAWQAAPDRVNLNWWKKDFGGATFNFGDALSPFLVREMLALRGIDVDRPVSGTRHLAALGSVLLWRGAWQDITVWGSGILRSRTATGTLRRRLKSCVLHGLLRRMDVRCVRGPMTRSVLREIGVRCPERYGDPGVLLPLFYRPRPVPARPYNVIFHHRHRTAFADTPGYVDVVSADWRDVVDQICAARINLCESLHALIISEAYGIPAVLLMPEFNGDPEDPELFKYRDYYLSTGRRAFPIVKTIDEGLALSPPVPDLTPLQQALQQSFPYDLWQ